MRSIFFKILLVIGIIVTVTSTAAMLTMAVTVHSNEKPSVKNGAIQAGRGTGNMYRPNNLIRFHVIANSDSERDQALKRRVRDLIIDRMTPEFARAKSIAEARRIAQENLGKINAVAKKEVEAWGEDYQVKTMIGRFNFPVKTYGNLTLPAGTYEAVRVVIGKGEGANWWCVLFPPLCFVDVSKAMSPMDVGDTVDAMSVKDRISLEPVPDDEHEKPQFELKFKVLELFGW